MVATVVSLFWIYLRFGEVDAQEAKLADLQSQVTKLQRNATNAAHLTRQLEAVKKINEQIAESVLKPSDLARNLQHFYTLEASNGVKLLDLRQQAPASGAAASAYTTLNFTVNVSGDYERLLKFMREVETTFLGGKIISATMSPGSALPDQDPAKARLLSLVVQVLASK